MILRQLFLNEAAILRGMWARNFRAWGSGPEGMYCNWDAYSEAIVCRKKQNIQSRGRPRQTLKWSAGKTCSGTRWRVRRLLRTPICGDNSRLFTSIYGSDIAIVIAWRCWRVQVIKVGFTKTYTCKTKHTSTIPTPSRRAKTWSIHTN
jgi:hypothetical protein